MDYYARFFRVSGDEIIQGMPNQADFKEGDFLWNDSARRLRKAGKFAVNPHTKTKYRRLVQVSPAAHKDVMNRIKTFMLLNQN